MADRYWVGGTGSWADTAHWSTSSGGSGGSAAPSSSDNVYFDLHSNEPGDGSYTVTVGAAGNCLNLSAANAGDSGTGVLTIAGTYGITVYGNYTLAAGVLITNTAAWTFSGSGSGTCQITTNGVAITHGFYFNNAGRTFQLQDNLTLSYAGRSFQINAGSFDAQTRTVTINQTGTSNTSIYGAFTFYNLVINGSSAVGSTYLINSNMTVTNSIILAGYSTTRRLFLRSYIRGTQLRITISGTSGNSYSSVDFQDIDLYDSAGQIDLSAITGLSGDAGGNNATNMLLTSPQSQYWYHPGTASANWSGANWRDATLTSTQRVPLPQDNVYFIAGSITASGRTVVTDMTILGKTIDLSAVANNPAISWSGGSTNIYICGSLIWGTHTFVNATTGFYLQGRGSYVITSNGLTNAANVSFYIDCADGVGTYTLSDDFIMGYEKSFSVSSGTFDANDKNLTSGSYVFNNTATIYMRSGTWKTLAASAYPISCGIGNTIYCGTSTLKITGVSTANQLLALSGSKTLYNVRVETGASLYAIQFNYSCTYNNIYIDASYGRKNITFGYSTTHIINSITRDPGTNIISIRNTSGTTRATLQNNGGGCLILPDYFDIDNIAFTSTNSLAAKWAYSGTHNVKGRNNSGITDLVDYESPDIYLVGVAPGPGGYTIVIDSASFALSFQNFSLLRGTKVSLDSQSMTITAQDIGVLKGSKISLENDYWFATNKGKHSDLIFRSDYNDITIEAVIVLPLPNVVVQVYDHYVLVQVNNEHTALQVMDAINADEEASAIMSAALGIESNGSGAFGAMSMSVLTRSDVYQINTTDIGLLKDSILPISASSYDIVGMPFGLFAGRKISLDGTSIDSTFQTVNLIKNSKLSIETGSVTLVFDDITLTYLTDKRIIISSASMSIETSPIGLRRDGKISIDSSEIEITAQDIGILLGRKLPIYGASIAINAADFSLLKGHVILISGTAYLVTGTDITLTWSGVRYFIELVELDSAITLLSSSDSEITKLVELNSALNTLEESGSGL